MSSSSRAIEIKSEQNHSLSTILEHYDIRSVSESIRDKRSFMDELFATIRPGRLLPYSSDDGLWIREASRRASAMLNLFLLLETKTWAHTKPSISAQLDCVLVETLLENYRELEAKPDRAICSCSGTLRSIVTGLVELFGPTIGTLEIKTEIAQFWLSSKSRRALILVASEIVLNLVLHAFGARSYGKIGLSVKLLNPETACLAVDSNGWQFDQSNDIGSLSIIGGLTRILDGEYIVRRPSSGGTRMEITFPIIQRQAAK
jgi:hypothetical protein